MSGTSGIKMVFGAALAAPLLGLILALVFLAFTGDVERIRPSENVFAAWRMSSEESELTDLSRALLERPLLWPSRRPLVPAAASADLDIESHQSAGPKKPALAGYRLAGMFLSELDAGVIVVSGNKRRRLIVGESIDGWMLEEIHHDGAVFVNASSNGSRTRSLVKLEHLLPAARNQSAGRTSTKSDASALQEADESAGANP